MKCHILLICLLISVKAFGQKQKCNCDVNEVKKHNKAGYGKNSHNLDSDIKYPLTTFHRHSGRYSGIVNEQAYIDAIREKFSVQINSSNLKSVYADIYSNGIASFVSYNIKVNSININAQIAKNAAFVALVNMDNSGQALTSYATYWDHAVDAIERLENKSEDGAVIFPIALNGNYTDKLFWTAKTLILYLQAYDYLKGVADAEGTSSMKADVVKCGRILHAYATICYQSFSRTPLAALGRQDNHGLTTAAAIGLASIVLHDHGAKRYSLEWQPEEWSRMANMRISQIMWKNVGTKRESAPKTQTDGDSYGFGEGTHYFKFSYENVLPFFLAYKNTKKRQDVNTFYQPRGIYLASLLRSVTVPQFGYTLKTNYWNDDDYHELYKWFSSFMLPSGEYISLDDSHVRQSFYGIAITRQDDLLPFMKTLHFTNLPAGESKFDLRCDLAAVLAEGYFTQSPDFKSQVIENAGAATVVFKEPDRIGLNLYHGQLFLNINAEGEESGNQYFGIWGHEQHDALSFSLVTAGKKKKSANDEYNYLFIEPGYWGGSKSWLRDVENHNTWMIKTEPLGSSSPKYIGPTDGASRIISHDFRSSFFQHVHVTGELENSGDRFLVSRKFVVREGLTYPTIQITDKVQGYRINGQLSSVNGFPNDHQFQCNLGGIGTAASSTFSLDSISGTYTATWRGQCDAFNLKAIAVVVPLTDGSANSKANINTHYMEYNRGNDNDGFTNSLKANFRNTNTVELSTIIKIVPCDVSITVSYYDNEDLPRVAQFFTFTQGNVKDFNAIQVGPGNFQINDFYKDSSNKVITGHAKTLNLVITTDSISSNPCDLGHYFRSVSATKANFLSFQGDTFFQSKDTLEELSYNYDKKYYYSGTITADTIDTVSFYMPEVPNPNLSLMTEMNGLEYTYDTATQKMTIILPDSGLYKINFEPSNPCAVSCYFPIDSIIDTFYFDDGSQQRLGHEMEILPDSGWLDITKGSKMLICSKAVLRNKDSLSISSGLALGEESIGYGQRYLSTEDQVYREDFSVGSGASGAGGSDRSMIIVTQDGALVLKDSSHTHVGCGGTILIKSGGTLKIENGATVTVGDECGGYGEIIIEDSAFLCIEDSAYIEFFNGKFDTADKHIFFISRNPKNPARVGVGDSSNVVQSSQCIDFCNLKDSFPTHGIANYSRGWINVGLPEAWFYTDSVICDGRDVWLNGIPTLNETRYRLTVCEYNKITETCTGTPVSFPSNQLDDYYGGRIEKINVTDTASLLRNKTYKITLKVLNDCDDESSFSRIVEIPTELVAHIEGDTLMCGGNGAIKVNGLNSVGVFDSLSWEIWEYVPVATYDSTEYYNNADSIIIFNDTAWLDSVTIDTILTYPVPFYYSDTMESDSFSYVPYYQSYFDTTIVSSIADTFQVDSIYFKPGQKYFVHLTLYNNCGVSRDTLIVRMRPGPDVDAGVDKYIAASHSSVTNTDPELEGSVTGYSGTPSWTPTSYLSSSTILNPVANPTVTTVYTLSAADAYGCVNTDSVTVFIDTFANAGADTLICYDDSAKVGIPLFAGNYDFNWSPGTWVSDSTIGEPYAYPDPNGTPRTIRVKVTNNTSLVEWDNIVIYADSTIDPTFSQMGGIAYDVIFNITENQVINENFTWVWGDGWINGTGNNPGHTYPPVPSSSYYTCVSYVNACGTVQWCDTVKFDALGNHIPTPPTPNTTYIEEATNFISFRIAPNPFQQETSISYIIGNAQANARIEIIGIDGKYIQSIKLNNNEGTVSLNMSKYESGMYYAKLIVDDSVMEVKKLIVNH